MKNISIASIILLLLVGCSTDDAPFFFFEVTPVDIVSNVPDFFVVGKTDTIQVTYKRPSTCHGFNGFDIVNDGDVREIAIITKVVQGRTTCSDLENDVRTAPLVITPEEAGQLNLSFFTGNNEIGDPTFVTFNVPIIE
ncbi:hypothetical protein [uncultured Dokdonia sp.]|uniref:hypothetical protein n=1 Tax=uncultured Dokdonia sp. TaxID=575653 RepID=UPI0026029F1F|nr:hypothetical protein [uncultured Dokdonia sp.]